MHDIPNDYGTDTEVFMRQDIAERYYLSPVNVFSRFFQRCWQAACSFADYLKISDDSILCFAILQKYFLIDLIDVISNLAYGLEDVIAGK